MPSVRWGVQKPLYVPFGALANDTSYVSFGCVMNGPDRLSTVFFMPALSAAAPPAGMESLQKVMLCGPPATLRKRTVPPAGTVTVLGSKAARVLPLPVILTSTTGPVAAVLPAGAGAAGGAFCVWFWSPPFCPQASALMATAVVSKAKRIAEILRNGTLGNCRDSTGKSLVNCFTIAVNIEGGPQNGSPPKQGESLSHCVSGGNANIGAPFFRPSTFWRSHRAKSVRRPRAAWRADYNECVGAELAHRGGHPGRLHADQAGRHRGRRSRRRLRLPWRPLRSDAFQRLAVRDLPVEEQVGDRADPELLPGQHCLRAW